MKKWHNLVILLKSMMNKNSIQKKIKVLLFISFIFGSIIIYLNSFSFSIGRKNLRKMNSYFYIETNPENNQKMDDSLLFFVIFIIFFIDSIIYIISLLLKISAFRNSDTNTEAYNIVLLYAFIINLFYLTLSGFAIIKYKFFQYIFIPSNIILFLLLMMSILRKPSFCTCNISLSDLFKYLIDMPIGNISLLLNICCGYCQDCGSGFSSSSSNRHIVYTIRPTSSNTESRTNTDSGGNGSSGNYLSSSSSSDNCIGVLIFILCKYLCFLFDIIFQILSFGLNFILYYLGLLVFSIIALILWVFYIIPLLLASLFENIECCQKSDEEIVINRNANNNIRNTGNQNLNFNQTIIRIKKAGRTPELSYSYYCKDNKKPLIATFFIIILLPILSLGIYIAIKKFLLKKDKIKEDDIYEDNEKYEDANCLVYNITKAECSICSEEYALYKGKCITYSIEATYHYSYKEYSSNSIDIINPDFFFFFFKMKINNNFQEPTSQYTFKKGSENNLIVYFYINNITSLSYMFANTIYLTKVTFHPFIDKYSIKDMEGMFADALIY